MDLRALDQSKYLKGSDLPANGVVATIGGFAVEQFDEGPKLVITWLTPGLKPMLCNKTNRQRLMAMLGTSDTNQMVGQQVWIYFDQFVEYGGKMVGGLRLKEAHQAAPEPAQAPIPPAPVATPAPARRQPQPQPADPAVAEALQRVQQRAGFGSPIPPKRTQQDVEQEWAGDDQVPF